MKIKICPKCNSSNIFSYMGGVLGAQYKCKACGYMGALVLEKDIDEESGNIERKSK